MTSSHIDTLIVFIKGERAGSIIHHENGRLSFAYKDGYSGNPLSTSMPISNKPYDDRRIRPYLMGLLPDSTDVRRAVAREYDVSANNPFALIAHIGLDLPGAVQVCANERDVERYEAYREITDSDIESRLVELIERDGASWLGLGEALVARRPASPRSRSPGSTASGTPAKGPQPRPTSSNPASRG